MEKKSFVLVMIIVLAISCKAQVPKCVECYDQSVIDSLNYEISNRNSQIDRLNFVNDSLALSNSDLKFRLTGCEILTAENDSFKYLLTELQTTLAGEILLKNEYVLKSDSLQRELNLLSIYQLYDTTYIVTDTAYLSVGDSVLSVLINKQGEYMKLSIFDNLRNRIYFTKRKDDFDYWIQQDDPDNHSETLWSGHILLKE
jgi:hypothetical protein